MIRCGLGLGRLYIYQCLDDYSFSGLAIRTQDIRPAYIGEVTIYGVIIRLSKEYRISFRLLGSDPNLYAIEADEYETEQLLDEVKAIIGSRTGI